MIDGIRIERRPRAVQSWATGRHLPRPIKAADGQWRCADCLRRLSRYTTAYGETRLRHNPRDRG